jgi:signal peptidase II
MFPPGYNEDRRICLNDTCATKVLPFSLTGLVIFFDQLTKLFILRNVQPYTVHYSLFDDFFRIIHVQNRAVAFSMGRGLPDPVKRVLFTILPLVVIALLIIYFFRTDELTKFQRWAIAGIVGGGVGNQIDRVFRGGAVVDFLDFKFFGIFGLERWPVFNIADSSVVVCGICLVISILVMEFRKENTKTEGSPNE